MDWVEYDMVDKMVIYLKGRCRLIIKYVSSFWLQETANQYFDKGCNDVC